MITVIVNSYCLLNIYYVYFAMSYVVYHFHFTYQEIEA